jgi:hypothetical protein
MWQQTNRSHQIACVLILLLHAVLSTFYSLTVPVWESNDETGHYAYARYIATQGHLPPTGEKLAGVDESHQPPLYYALVALAIRGIDTSDDVKDEYIWTERVKIRPDPRLTDFPTCVPACGTALANHVGRLVSVALSTLAVWCVYLTARLLAPQRMAVALYATALFAVWPMLLFTGGVLNNDNGVIVFGATALLFATRLLTLQRQAMTMRQRFARGADYVLLALSAGLASLSKSNGVSIVLFASMVVLGLAVRDWSRRQYARAAGALAYAGVLAIAVVIGYVVSDGRTLGQWAGTLNYASAFVAPVAPGNVGAPSRIADALSWLVKTFFSPQGLWVFDSLFGLFGWSTIGMPQPWYGVAHASALAVAVVLAVALITRKRLRLPLVFLGCFFLCVASPVWVRAALAHDGSWLHGRFYLAGMAAISIAVTLSIFSLPRIPRTLAASLLLPGVALVGLMCPWLVIKPVFDQSPLRVEHTAEYTPPNPSSITYGDAVELVGYKLPKAKTSRAGWTSIMLYWRALRPISTRYTLRLESFSVDGTSFGSVYESEPALGAFPTTAWKAGDIYAEGYYFPVWEHVALPTVATFKVSWFDQATGRVLPAVCSPGGPCDPKVARLPVALDGPEVAEWLTVTPRWTLGEQIGLLDARASAVVTAGRPLTVSLTWRALAAGLPDRTVFVHLVDASGVPVSQVDAQPRAGAYPTSVWSAGEIVPDVLTLPLGNATPPGDYTLVAGMYDPLTQQRMPVVDRDGLRLADDMIVLQHVKVIPPP